MNRYFYFLVFVSFFAFLPHLVYGMEDQERPGCKQNPPRMSVDDEQTDDTNSQPAGIFRSPDGNAAIIYGYSREGVACGPLSSLEEALTNLPDHPVYESFAARYMTLEERITSLQKDGRAFEERWKNKAGEGSNVIALFCEDFGLGRDQAEAQFGAQKLKESARKYLTILSKMHDDYQKNVIKNLRRAQDLLNIDLRIIVGEFSKERDILKFLQFQAQYYQEELNIFVKELSDFSANIQLLKEELKIGEQLLNEESLKYTTFYRYRIGNLILQHNLLRIIKGVVTPFLEFFPGWEHSFIPLPESDFDQLLSKHLFSQRSNSVKEKGKGRKGTNRRQVNKSNKVKTPKKDVADTTNLASVRGLSLYRILQATDFAEFPSFLSADPLPPGGYKSQYRQTDETSKEKTHKVSAEKEKGKGREEESETSCEAQVSKETSSQGIFYVKNPHILELLNGCGKVELKEYLNLLNELVFLNPTVFQPILEIVGQHGTHPVYRLWFRNGTSYSWEISQAHGGRFIPQNHNYRKSYKKPFKFLGILKTGLKDIQEKKGEVEKGYEPKDQANEGADSETKNKKKRNRNRNRKKKGNNTPKDQSSKQKEETDSGAS
ncbi:MAG: hypothetical protein BGO67_02395 [Alphaproteobacteria bacterium 41-28]|nr:MAG: hypothetical protein BGO67_02395 [Alphaproteobacteria bacterium 41-28]